MEIREATNAFSIDCFKSQMLLTKPLESILKSLFLEPVPERDSGRTPRTEFIQRFRHFKVLLAYLIDLDQVRL